MSPAGIWVRVVRGGEVESRHRVDGIAVGLASGREVLLGRGDLLTYWRSSFKPFQALPLVEDGAAARFDLPEEAVALSCASHGGTRRHVAIARAMLERIGRTPEDLACGSAAPMDRRAARRLDREGSPYGRLHNNCSGKHAGMLATAIHAGWPVEGYEEYDHPLQARIRRGLSRWLDVAADRLTWGVDGCGLPTPYLSLRQMARAYARLVRMSREEPAPGEVVTAMRRHPTLISGEGRLAARLVQATEGRLLAKDGAEGVFCVAEPEEGWGMALKVRDGARRALGPATATVLGELGLLEDGERDALEEVARPRVTNTLGREVGWIDAEVRPRQMVPAHPVEGAPNG